MPSSQSGVFLLEIFNLSGVPRDVSSGYSLPKQVSIHGWSHDSSHICSRGRPYLTSTGGEGGLMPHKGMLDGGVRVGEWVEENPYRGKGKGGEEDEMGGCGGVTRKGDII